MAIFAYGRVSTREQTVENQRQEIERAGFKIDYWFADEGVSGKVPAMKRLQFSRMLDKIRDGETLVVSKVDRLGRDAGDIRATMDELASRNIEIIVLQFGKVDMKSPVGKMIQTVLSAVGEMERDMLVERTQAGLNRAKAEGKTLGRPPKTTDTIRQRILDDYQIEGASISQLSKRYSVSRLTISRIIAKSAGIPVKDELHA